MENKANFEDSFNIQPGKTTKHKAPTVKTEGSKRGLTHEYDNVRCTL
jgi:hypothetical protein